MLCFPGDLMQLKPIRGDYIFEQPKHHSLHAVYNVFSLWGEFEVVVLEENHRQGEDKVYAELLGRLRFKERDEAMSEEDLAFLQSKILPPEHEETTFQIYGKNASVNIVNERRLNLLPTKLFTIEATHNPAKRKINVKPTGTIEETAFFQTLRLKIGARIMLIHNVNTGDALTNGAQGVVEELLTQDNRVRYVLIKFDNPSVGQEQRNKLRFLPSVAKRPDLTPIEKFAFSYTLGDARKNHGATAILYQYPLKLSWAATSHKVGKNKSTFMANKLNFVKQLNTFINFPTT